jgi:CBS domain-containing protein
LISVNEIAIKKSQTIQKNGSLFDAVVTMESNANGVIVILDGSEVVGILTERDIVKTLNEDISFYSKALDYATKNVICINKNRDIHYALNVMLDNNIRRLVLINDDASFVNVIVQEELLSHLEKGSYQAHLKISDVIKNKTNIKSLSKENTIKDAMKLMDENKIGSVVVIEDDEVIGIFTEKDSIKLVSGQIGLDTKLDDIMTRPVVTSKSDEKIIDVVSLMQEKAIRRIVVVNEDKKAINVLGIRDILKIIQGNYNSFLENKLESSRQLLNSIEESIFMINKYENKYLIQWLNKKAKNTFGLNIIDKDIIEVFGEKKWNEIMEKLQFCNEVNDIKIEYNDKKFEASFFGCSVQNKVSVRAILKDVTSYELKIEEEIAKRLQKRRNFATTIKICCCWRDGRNYFTSMETAIK